MVRCGVQPPAYQSRLIVPASGPLAPCTTPIRTDWPSCNGPSPARSSTVAWMNTSLPPDCGRDEAEPLVGVVPLHRAHHVDRGAEIDLAPRAIEAALRTLLEVPGRRAGVAVAVLSSTDTT